MKRLVTLAHFPLVGAPSSVGQVYLGPFYYYFMAPWLALFNFNPIGPAVGVALLSTAFILIVYYAVTDLFNAKAGIIASTMVAVSAVLVDLSRFSWNPNVLPIFSFIAFYFLMKALLTAERRFFILSGVFLAIAFQLHYVTFSLLFAYGLLLLFYIWKNSATLVINIKKILWMGAAFVIVNIPLILFDMRHEFLNSKNFITLFQKPGATESTSLMSIMNGFSSLTTYTFSLNLTFFGEVMILFGLLLSVKLWKDKEYRYLLSIFLLALLATSFMTANKYPHYFGALYPLYYVLLAVAITRLTELKKNFVGKVISAVFIVLFFIIQILHYPFFIYASQPNRQIVHAQNTAKKIYPLITKEKFRVTGIPDGLGTSMYAYYLELWGKTPANNLSLDPADEMFVICEQKCAPIGNPQWDIAYFKPRQVQTSFQSNHVYIYKLIK